MRIGDEFQGGRVVWTYTPDADFRKRNRDECPGEMIIIQKPSASWGLVPWVRRGDKWDIDVFQNKAFIAALLDANQEYVDCLNKSKDRNHG